MCRLPRLWRRAAFCADCFRQYLELRIGERACLDMPCPAREHGSTCRPIGRPEVAAFVSAEDLRRYDTFLASERAERDPDRELHQA